jgi:putative Holliday junction resolvase
VSPAARGAALAIDHGTKRTGFAIADPLRIAVHPLETFRGPGDGQELVAHVATLLAERTVTTFVLGFPYAAGGAVGARAKEVEAFAARLAARFPEVEVVRWDERLTTKAAEDLLREAGHHGEARKARRDSWSALVLLRDWIASGEPR